jgi:hypothetical protein
MSAATWPPPWTLKPTEGDPHDAEPLDGCEGIGWDLSFGFRLNIAHDTAEDVNSPLTIGAHFSDADLARGFVQRQVTPDQLDTLARLLLGIAAKQRAREAAASSHCEGITEAEADLFMTARCGRNDPHRAHRHAEVAR